MQLIVLKAFWGMDGSTETNVERIASAGYDGAEVWIAEGAPSAGELMALTEAHGLKRIVATRVMGTADLDGAVKRLAEYQPLKINFHSGVDSMTAEEGNAYFEEALRLEQAVGIPVVHETHRQTLLYAPWITAAYLRTFPELSINADYSHWTVVCERMLHDQGEALALANRRVRHIHGRVGYEEGPQVPDPSAPEYARHLAWFEQQWSEIKARQAEAGETTLTFTPEYGPPAYLHTLPNTNVPVADLWTICLWAKERARQTLGQDA